MSPGILILHSPNYRKQPRVCIPPPPFLYDAEKGMFNGELGGAWGKDTCSNVMKLFLHLGNYIITNDDVIELHFLCWCRRWYPDVYKSAPLKMNKHRYPISHTHTHTHNLCICIMHTLKDKLSNPKASQTPICP